MMSITQMKSVTHLDLEDNDLGEDGDLFFFFFNSFSFLNTNIFRIVTII